MKIKKLIIALLCISFVFCLAGCGSEAKKSMDTAVNSANEEATTTSASADSRSETDSGLDNTNSNSDISNTDETDMASIQNSVMNLFGFESSLADEDSISDEDSGALARLEAQLGLAS